MDSSATEPPVARLLSHARAWQSDYGTENPPTKSRPSHDPLGSGNSTFVTANILIADLVGAGVLSLGVAIAKFGWLLGSVVAMLMVAMNVHVSVLLWRVRMSCEGPCTYLDLASASFARAPRWQRRLMEEVTKNSQQIALCLMMSLYILTAGRSLGNLFYNELRSCTPLLVAIVLTAFTPISCSARNMGHHSALFALNILLILCVVIIPLVHMASTGVGETRGAASRMQAFEELRVAGVLSGLQTMAFALTSQCMVVEIIAEMEEPADFPKAYFWTVPLQAFTVLTAGVGAYYYKGSGIASGVLSDNMPFGGSFRVVAFCLTLHMLIGFLVKGLVAWRFAHSVWSPESLNDTSARGWGAWCATVTVITVLCWFGSQVVPFFTDFVDLTGATLIPITCLILPIVMYVRWLHDSAEQKDAIGPVEAAVIAAELLLSAVLLVFGTYFTVVSIIDKWGTYGLPFACHCEDLWATCECSAQHVGMEHCLSG